MTRINIAIDGYAGCGKSTLARDLAVELNYTLIDSGALYRGMTLLLLRSGVATGDEQALTELLRDKPPLDFHPDSNHLLLDGEDVEFEIRQSKEVINVVSDVAASPKIRDYLKSIQRQLIAQKGVVMEGRDIGTVIMPEAELKLFITASIEERVKRRRLDLEKQGQEVSAGFVMDNLIDRDRKDAGRDTDPLSLADDAVCIDTTEFSREEQLKVVLALIRPLTESDIYLPFIG